jgi:hypothetical protein
VALPQPQPGEQLPHGGPPPPPSSSRVGSSPAGRSQGAVWFTVCAWCERVRFGGSWMEAGRALALIEPAHEPQLTHGICPGCFDAVMRHASRDRDRDRGIGSDAA